MILLIQLVQNKNKKGGPLPDHLLYNIILKLPKTKRDQIDQGPSP